MSTYCAKLRGGKLSTTGAEAATEAEDDDVCLLTSIDERVLEVVT
jgi:hypothetical protein